MLKNLVAIPTFCSWSDSLRQKHIYEQSKAKHQPDIKRPQRRQVSEATSLLR